MSDFTIAVLVALGLLVAYRLGYHHGVASCIKPLEDAAGDLREMRRRR